MANLRGLSGLRGSEWVAWVRVGCVGQSGLRGSEWVAWVRVGCVGQSGLRGQSGLSGLQVKPHFHASLIFFTKR